MESGMPLGTQATLPEGYIYIVCGCVSNQHIPICVTCD
jgi:hypothetical protein